MGTNWRPADPLTGRRNRNGSISPLLISRTHMMRSKVASPPTHITVPAQQNALAQRCSDIPGMPLRLWHFKVAAPNPQKDSCIRTYTTQHMMRPRRQTSISSPGGNLPMLLSGRRRGLLPPCLVVAVVVVLSAASVPRADAYKNCTVGDDKGWYDGLTLPGVDYQQWADGYNFSLGDFLIFNTDKNHSVVQTRNQTLYKSCDYNDSGPDDTIEWSAAAPEFSKDAVTVAVPLLKEGPTYFFSGNYDGEQCENGQRFAITVAHGQGLPPDLRQPAAEAPAPAAGPGASADAAPVLDFSHPKNVSTPDTTAPDDEPSSSTSGSSRPLAGLWPDLVMAMLVTVLFAVQVV